MPSQTVKTQLVTRATKFSVSHNQKLWHCGWDAATAEAVNARSFSRGGTTRRALFRGTGFLPEP